MEKLERYRTYIKQLLSDYASLSPSEGEAETELIFDTERDRYQVVHTGWKNRQPLYGCVLHLDIKGGKVWIHHDGTEIDIASKLVNLGVPKSDIVLAFHEPLVRQYTGFAVG
ncbi:XisI protein [Mastigocoleus testarum]|uniref:Fatty-acid oxidation protein subunit alpha n=1 Tax=Mastigocoleus testarum BC008 TaxID=371196 RepID=A0A0V7ZZ14_9CYAN|nr:XisI protein [Mastigocoleus testarum]KST69836.1 fatty-acid oxidation protein subunit alpha [Mastigocoleus testarum BC008]